MTLLLEASDLRAFYGSTEVLHQLAFSVGEGTITALLGANGAGKTTTLRAICGLVRSSGEVRFTGTPIGGRATEDIVRLGIAHVPEGRGTFLSFTVEENLQLGAQYTAYTRFNGAANNYDGSGRNASANNTVYLDAKFLF